MSIHLMHEAARRRLKPSAKLVLLCLAESARDGERRAWPGADVLMSWAGVSRPRLFALLKDLTELRLIEQVKRGQKYQRAEYVVFPDGCCEMHPAIVSGSSGRDAEQPVESLTGKTLNGSQGLVSVPQGLVQNVSGSRRQDPSRKTNLIHLPELPPDITTPRPALVPAPEGVFDGVRAALSAKKRTSA